MPELPEVEITRRHLADAMQGRVFLDAHVRHPRTARHNGSDPSVVRDRLVGRRIEEVGRHGKFLLLSLDNGMTMVAHLGMSGRFVVAPDPEASQPHTHFEARLDDETVVVFVDPRTFGFVAVYDDEELATSGVARLGPDAWENAPSAEQLAVSLRARTAPIKALLLDQAPIAGLGNIYADEALFLAGINPKTPGGELDVPSLGKLTKAIRTVLQSALDHGGTSLDDLAYLLPDGRAGENMSQLKVYGRDGEACFECGEIIDKVVIRARSTHFCPGCQSVG